MVWLGKLFFVFYIIMKALEKSNMQFQSLQSEFESGIQKQICVEIK